MDHSIFHGKAIKFLLSVSVFSILFTHSSLISFLVQFSNAIVSSLSVRLFSFDKNCMFLVCNGLLVCIVKNSALTGTSVEGSNLNSDEDHVKFNVESPEIGLVDLKETKTEMAEEDQVINVECEQALLEEEEEECNLVNVEDDEEFEAEVAEEEEAEILSTEELNKKCDEFIRKVREGIKLEVQQSMIMVSCH